MKVCGIVIVIFVIFIAYLLIKKFWGRLFPKKAVALRLYILMSNGQKSYINLGEKFTMRRGDVFDAYLEPVDVNGDPTTLDGPARWTNSDDNICSIEVDPDNDLHIIGTCHDVLGSSIIEARGDGDLDPGETEVTELVATGVCTVVGDDAVSAEIRFEVRQQVPETKPAAEPETESEEDTPA